MSNVPDSSKVKEMLQQDGYLDAVKLIELLEGSVNQNAELLYLRAFARESSFDDDLSREQFRCLWTAYCFHHERIVDTAEYDDELRGLWDFMVNCGYPLIRWWESYDGFDAFMCKYLV